jgi:hypothetical protein
MAIQILEQPQVLPTRAEVEVGLSLDLLEQAAAAL